MDENTIEIPLEVRPGALSETLDKLTKYQDVAKMLADELRAIYDKRSYTVYGSKALMAYRKLTGEK